MKASELKEILSRVDDDFEVELSKSYVDPNASYGYCLDSYKITGLADIGYSDKVICLDIEKK